MEVAFFVVAIIGLLALTASSQNAQAQAQQQAQYQTGPPETWSPTPAGSYPPPGTPSTFANINGNLNTGSAQIGTQLLSSGGAAAGVGTTAALAAGAITATTAAAITAGVGLVVAVGIILWQKHEARLKGATNENQAVDQYIPVFDSYIAEFVQLWNSGQMTAADAAQSVQRFDKSIYNSFRSLVGAPGTAWNDSVGMSGQCNKSCTVGCCVYFSDLGPVLNNISYILGFPTGKWGQGDPRISGRTITVPKVFPSRYSSYTRELYTITLK